MRKSTLVCGKARAYTNAGVHIATHPNSFQLRHHANAGDSGAQV